MGVDGERSGMTWVAGVDGCRGGWLASLVPLDTAADAAPRIELHATIETVIGHPLMPRVIAIDMPIGLPDRVGIGGRTCDVEARRNLGGRQSALFAVPSRAAVMQTDYAAACSVALTTSDPPRKVSKQCFNLFPKIRALDALMTPALHVRVFEVHPELAFWAMNDRRPLDEPKKVKSRPCPRGLELRRHLLARGGMAATVLAPDAMVPRGAGADDLLDALACAWSARRIARGVDVAFPGQPEHDAKGLRMQIRA